MGLFAKKHSLICPTCLTGMRSRKEIETCIECKEEIPQLYRSLDGQRSKPLFIQIVGWSSVGKTFYLEALYEISRRMGRRWKNFFGRVMNQEALDYFRTVREARSSGRIAPPTPRGQKSVHILGWHNMVRWANRTLVTRDCAGEHFINLEFDDDQAMFIARVPTTFLMIDLTKAASGPSMDELLNSYVATLNARKIDVRKQLRRVVVILSKGDVIPELPENVRGYLASDPIRLQDPQQALETHRLDEEGMQRYLETMGHVSRELKDWLCRRDDAHNLARMADEYNITLRFTVVSSTGDDVEGLDRIDFVPKPMRVMDPIFWAFHFEEAY